MEWIGIGLLAPLLFCGGMCVVGAVLAFLGIRRVTESTQDTNNNNNDDWDEWFDASDPVRRPETTGGRR